MATSFKFFQCQKGHFIQFRTKNRNKTTCSLFAEFYDTWQVYSLTEKLMLCKILFGKKKIVKSLTLEYWLGLLDWHFAFLIIPEATSDSIFVGSFSKPKKGRRSGHSGLQNFIVFVGFFPVLAFFREKMVWGSMPESFSEIRNHRESNFTTGKKGKALF